MTQESLTAAVAAVRESALSRWDNEGGAIATPVSRLPANIPQMTNAELVQLRIRVIALENLVISLLAEASVRQIELAREMAAFIAPRPGYSQHPVTTHASAQMIKILDRANQFRTAKPS